MYIYICQCNVYMYIYIYIYIYVYMYCLNAVFCCSSRFFPVKIFRGLLVLWGSPDADEFLVERKSPHRSSFW